MFKTINTSNEARTFQTYAEAHRFVMREGDQSRLWSIVAPNVSMIEACRAERAAFIAA